MRALSSTWGLAFASLACVDRGAVLTPGAAPQGDGRLVTLAVELVASSTEISAGEMHSCALRNARLYCWGDNMYGESGSATETNRAPPTAIPGSDWQSINAAETHSCALNRAGEVYCWGDNERGQLGQGDRVATNTPVLVPLPRPTKVLAGGFHHNCVILEDATLWCWGDGNEGQLGRGDIYPGNDPKDEEKPSRAADALVPERVQTPQAMPAGSDLWQTVNTGQGHTCGLQMDHSLWCWGRNSQRQLGQPSETGQIREPVRVGPNQDWKSVDAAQQYTCALETNGSLWCWGYNMGFNTPPPKPKEGNPFGVGKGQLDEPTLVSDSDRAWSTFDTNMLHSCALDTAADLWCWGRNIEGQLGSDDPPYVPEPTRVASGIAQVSVGTYSTCTRSLDGVIACAGKNERGQLGGSQEQSETRFVEVSLPQFGQE